MGRINHRKEGETLKIAIMSDIHGNWEALQAVFRDITEQGATRILCLGDTVGYGPQPRECLEAVWKQKSTFLKGNHEAAVCLLDTEKKNIQKVLCDLAFSGIVYARFQLADKHLKFMRALPETYVLPKLGISLAHGAFSRGHTWRYINTEETAGKELKAVTTPLCFIGHTHSAFVFGSKKGHYGSVPVGMPLKDEKFLINVGSVGQPRDGDCRAAYVILEMTEQGPPITLRRVFYDIGETERAIINAKLPRVLAERLYCGE